MWNVVSAEFYDYLVWMRERRDTDASQLDDKVKVVSLQNKTLVWKRVDQDDIFHLRYVKLRILVSQSTKMYGGELNI